jgi:dihydrofolate reductase
MGKVVADMTTSLDGFVAGPNDGPELPLGEGGERLHQWLYDLASWRSPHGLAGGKTNPDSEVLGEGLETTGAIVVGRRMFDNARGWGDNPPFHMPVFVLAHQIREKLEKEGGTTFTFIADGIESALEQARAAADEKDVGIGGGASTIQQYLRAGLLDEIQIHIAPMLLGRGIRLFADPGYEQVDLQRTRVVEGDGVTHLRFRVVGQPSPARAAPQAR